MLSHETIRIAQERLSKRRMSPIAPDQRPRVLAVVGPTGIGKTELALRIGERVPIEVVGADSRQVFRHMDIGTAKPTPNQLARVPHHLVSVVDPDFSFSLGEFVPRAKEAIRNVKVIGKIPVIVGGTGQYVIALVESWNLPSVAPNPDLRLELENQLQSDGIGALVKRLESLEPLASRAVDTMNPRRLIRAIEVASAGFRDRPRLSEPEFDISLIGLTTDRQRLYTTVDRRVDRMMKRGFLDEVKALISMGYDASLPSMSGIGYRELVDHILNGASLDEAVRTAKIRTHRFIRQQYNWFSLSDPRIRWFDTANLDAAIEYGIRWAGCQRQA